MLALFDTDYCFKLQLQGARIHFVPEAVLHIRFRDTIPGIRRQARTWGQYHVLLYKRYRPYGMPKLSWKDGARAWKELLTEVPHIRSKAAWANWVWRFSWRLGRVRGCLKYRVMAL